MKLKFSNKQRRIISEWSVIIFLLVVSILACLSDIGVCKIPSMFVLRVINQEDLFFSLFGVQATISSVGIAIIALLSGANTESVYGICFSRYISHIKPIFLKHNRLIIINLVVTLINYFVVSYQLFNLSIALFFISILISIRLVRDTYVIFLGRREMKKQIGQYVIDNYDQCLLEEFSLTMNDPEYMKNISYTKENFELLESVFKRELSNLDVEDKSDIIKLLEEISTESTVNIFKKNEPQLTLIALRHLLNVYTIANENGSKLSLYIWDDIIPEYFDSLKVLMYNDLKESGVFWDIYRQLYHNRKINIDKHGRVSNNYLKYYSTWLYNAILKNKYRETFDMTRITKRIYDDIVSLYRYDREMDDIKQNILMSELCIFAQNLIDCGDATNLSKLYVDVDFYSGEEYKQNSLCVILIYIYYLICREPLAKEDDRKLYAEQVLKENISEIQYFLKTVNILKLINDNLVFIRDLMRTWEIWLDGKMKTLIIDEVINDFFVFATLERFHSREELKEVIYKISPDDSFSIYTTYFSGDGKWIKEKFSEFQSVFFNKTEDSEFEEKIDLLKSVLYEKYRNEELKEGIDEQITDEDKLRFSNLLESEFENIINENSSLLNSTILPQGTVKESVQILEISSLPNITFRESSLSSFLSRELHNCIIGVLLYKLTEHIKTETVGTYDCDIPEKLIKLVNTHNINGDTYLGNRDVFWNAEDKNLLKNFVSSMNKINFQQGYSQMFILDSASLYFKCSNIRVEFEDLTEIDIQKKCKIDENGVIMYNVTNDIYIPFEKDELIEHVNRITKKAKIFVDVSYKIEGTVGVGILIDKNSKKE